MPEEPKNQPNAIKLSRATVRKINKLATGPLLGPVSGNIPDRPSTGELTSGIAPLGGMMGVHARIARALGDEAKT